jgi:hypothetical protein
VGRLVEHPGVLGVHDHQPAEARDLGQRGVELVGAQGRELVDARRGEEALEPEDTGLPQRPQVGEVAGHGAAPEAHVHARLLGRHLLLEAEVVDGGGGRDGVQRHVDDRGDAAAGGGRRRRREPLPLGAAGLVDVHVGVDDAGQQPGGVGQVHRVGGVAPVVVRRHLGDPAVGDAHRGGTEGTVDQDVAGAHGREGLDHVLSPPS